MNIKRPISLLTLTLTPFFITTGCSSTGTADNADYKVDNYAGNNATQTSSSDFVAIAPNLDITLANNITPYDSNNQGPTKRPPIIYQTPEELEIEDGIITSAVNSDVDSEVDSAADNMEINTATKISLMDPLLTIDIPLTKNSQPEKRIFKFDFDLSELSENEKNIINKHANYLTNNPSQTITLHGHADSQGDPIYNQYLSEKRARYVANLLKQAGVQETQIEIFSWSSHSPADMVTNYKANRRVELKYSEDYVAQKHF